MRILLIHNPKAGDRKHSKKQLMATLTSTMQKITEEELGREMLERVKTFRDLLARKRGQSVAKFRFREVAKSKVPGAGSFGID